MCPIELVCTLLLPKLHARVDKLTRGLHSGLHNKKKSQTEEGRQEMQAQSGSSDRLRDLANATARVLIASYFIAVALGVIIDPNGILKLEAFSNMPNYVRWPSASFEMLTAISILVGFQTRMSVALLALYVFWSSFIFNYIPSNDLAIGSFWRDLAMIGGLLLLFAHGTGRYSLDDYLLRRKAKSKRRCQKVIRL